MRRGLENALVAAASFGFVVLLLAAIEGTLRVAGIGAPDASRASRLKYQQIVTPVLQPATNSQGDDVYVPADMRVAMQAIAKTKSPRTLRVFVFGESAVAGLGFSPNVTFVRHLERLLVEAHPEREVEVFNLGIVALSSRQIRLLVEEVAEHYAPDLLVVYCGNNEFLEIHAEKYLESKRTIVSAAADWVGETHLVRTMGRAIYGPPKAPSLANQNFSNQDLRLTQEQIIDSIQVSDPEIEAIIGEYESNIEAMSRSASKRSIPIVLMAVASNWEWRGRQDLPAEWVTEEIGSAEGTPAERYQKAVEILNQKLATPSPKRHELLYRRAVAQRELGNFEAARGDYRAAMNADPHLRRALDAMNARVAGVAQRTQATFFDTPERLSKRGEHGIVGFADFYDYVHFTPRGAILTGSELYSEIERSHLASQTAGTADAEAYIARELGQLDGLAEDRLGVYDWLGIGFDPKRIADRDLWKYDRMVTELGDLLKKDPNNFRALVYQGNAKFFRIDGGAEAAESYEHALRIHDDSTVQSNLEALRRIHAVGGRPGTALR